MSTKQMTAQEIADINKDFAIGNALTKWKFMQTPEYERLPDAARYTVERECLSYYFDKLTEGMTDWKMPIKTLIPISDLNPMRAACEYFTGTELSVLEQINIGYFKVFAKGYYMMGD